MRRSLRSVLAAAALVIAACSDSQLAPEGARDRAIQPLAPRFSLVAPPAVCPSVNESQATVNTLLPQLFGPGQGRRGQAQNYSNNIEQARRRGDTQLELANVDSLINFTLANYYAGNLIGGQTTATQIRVLNFFYALHCASGILPTDLSDIFLAENTQLIRHTTPTTTVSAGLAAVLIEQGDVPGGDFFGTFVSVIRTGLPLPTSLDWYGVDGLKQGAFEFISNPPVTFTNAVLTGVCIEFDNAIAHAADLRLAHAVEAGYIPEIPGNSVVTTAGGTIEVTAYADPGPLGLDCEPLPPPPSASQLGRILQEFANLFVPTPLYAVTTGGSTGGTVRKFSPFAAVDTKLNGTGSAPGSPQYIPVGSTAVGAPVSVIVTSNAGNVVGGLGVDFAPAARFAPNPATSNGSGVASATWSLVAGSNAAAATLSEPLTFATPVTFAATAVQLTALSITTMSLPGGQQSVSYGPATLAAVGGAGAGSYSWSLAAGSTLPGGLSLSTGGVLSGTPTVNGQFTFTVRVTSGPLAADKAFTVNILMAPVLIMTASPLPGATVGLPYSKALQATGGDGTYTWSVTAGTLPAGLTLSSGGTLSGTPTAASTASFTIQAASAGGTLTGSKSFTLTAAHPSALGSLSFQQTPADKQCYAVNVVITPAVAVKVTSTSGQPLAGVRVDLAAVINNGSKVQITQPFAITGADGRAVFNSLAISKTGGYRLIASTDAPWPVASMQSGKFTISPAC